MNISQAIEALKEGKIVRNNFWPNSMVGIFVQVPAQIGSEIVPKMQSLPSNVKEHFQKTFEDKQQQSNSIYYVDQIALIGLSNTITSFSFSNSDILSGDWNVVD